MEPILENAIGTLSKVIDLGSPLMGMVAPPPPPPKPVVTAPAGPDLS